jgi:hypothetical protein
MASNDPFFRHRKTETQPEPVQVQPVVKAVEINPKPTAAAAPAVKTFAPTKPVEGKPATKPARTVKAFDPFAGHTGRKEWRPKPVRTQVPPAQRLMAWLPRWPKATISVRDVRLYGPNSLRDPKLAADAIAVLTGYGWLIPVQTRQHNMNSWQIVRGQEPSCSNSRCSRAVAAVAEDGRNSATRHRLDAS